MINSQDMAIKKITAARALLQESLHYITCWSAYRDNRCNWGAVDMRIRESIRQIEHALDVYEGAQKTKKFIEDD